MSQSTKDGQQIYVNDESNGDKSGDINDFCQKLVDNIISTTDSCGYDSYMYVHVDPNMPHREVAYLWHT